MQCPNDQTTLAMTERHGVEIDYCPTCRGVWLDKGELDKLISGNENYSAPVQPTPPQYQQQRPNYDDDQGYQKKKHKKESFLADMFDF